jgi:hypothetical protein
MRKSRRKGPVSALHGASDDQIDCCGCLNAVQQVKWSVDMACTFREESLCNLEFSVASMDCIHSPLSSAIVAGTEVDR